MFYLPPQEFWYLTVARLTVFSDTGKTGIGTGFFILDENQYYLVTARHVVDPTYLPPIKRVASACTKVQIAFQCAINSGTQNADFGHQILEVTEPEFIYENNDLDLASLKIPKDVLPMLQSGKTIRPCAFARSFLASKGDLAKRFAGEPVILLGFPDNSPFNQIGESRFHYPILRQGVFAYPPIHGISVIGELGCNYGLIDSYAQSGFSGGPIVSLQKGWADGSWHPKEDHRPPKVVGVVCGHYRSAQDRADGGHAGLSYFARSNSILELIEQQA